MTKDEPKSADFSDAEFEHLLELAFWQRGAGSGAGKNPADLEMKRKTGFSGERQKEGDTV